MHEVQRMQTPAAPSHLKYAELDAWLQSSGAGASSCAVDAGSLHVANAIVILAMQKLPQGEYMYDH